ncbi:deoxynucleoside kinase-like [Sitophilus oryzae]|uniref:Deoxynucleoside kinase-like n=1 Tax=Sitophilus oryzae TaxID=7048 RepID=A0A6J2XTA3_SITOR|nr:deoxynucleoside kinase-like [Sitophilus oryzae]
MRLVKQRITKLIKSSKLGSGVLNRPFTVGVEGNIGSGKTTFLEHFKNHEDVHISAEPVDRWRNLNGHNLLGLLYQDPQKWSFTFQSYVQLTMLQNHLNKIEKPVNLMERSIFSARYCFVEKLSRDGILSPPSVAVIDSWFHWITTKMNVDVDLIVYLRTSPEVVYQRILKRNRPEEISISLDYIKSLHELHEDWLYHKRLHKCPAPVLIVDADLDKTKIKKEYQRWEPNILNKKFGAHI